MAYRVEVAKRAEEQLAKLNKKDLLLVAHAIDELEQCENPCALPNAKKLQDVEDGWRWRVGVYRLLGVVDGDRLIIELFKVGNRRDVYRNLNQ